MRTWILVTLLIASGGCTSAASDAEERYEIVKRGGDAQSICSAGRKVVDAYLAAKDENKYHEWDTRASIECQTAWLKEQHMEPDRMVTDDLVTNTSAPSSEDPPLDSDNADM
jgi:hypothetical protein